MELQYRKLYEELIKAYYENHFEETLVRMYESFESKELARNVLTVICGVEDIDKEDEFAFIQAIVQQIVNHQVRNKVINKIKKCNEECGAEDGKTKCELVCPLDAIMMHPMGNDRFIDDTKCISCGRCIDVCEHHSILDTPEFLPVAGVLKEEKVFAIVAPAIAGQFGKNVSLDQLREAMIRVGFNDMIEVAMAADILSLKEALEFNHLVENKKDVMISSCCCPVWVRLLRQVYHKLIPELSPSVSPMIAMGRIIKAMQPEAKVVFVGPCVAKKGEAKEKDLDESIDYVLTFEEMETIFDALEIKPEELKGIPAVDYACTGGRLYARSGGVSQAVFDIVDQMFPEKRKLFKRIHVDGVKDCRAILEKLEKKEVKATFIEGMACPGGCVGGPRARIDQQEGRKAANATAYESAIKIPVNSEVMNETLRQLGIHHYEELVEHGSLFEREFK